MSEENKLAKNEFYFIEKNMLGVVTGMRKHITEKSKEEITELAKKNNDSGEYCTFLFLEERQDVKEIIAKALQWKNSANLKDILNGLEDIREEINDFACQIEEYINEKQSHS
jgi:hypothetical protein